MREGEAPAYYNAMEAATVADLVSGVLQQAGSTVAANDLGVMATYRKQARAICAQAAAHARRCCGSARLCGPGAVVNSAKLCRCLGGV